MNFFFLEFRFFYFFLEFLDFFFFLGNFIGFFGFVILYFRFGILLNFRGFGFFRILGSLFSLGRLICFDFSGYFCIVFSNGFCFFFLFLSLGSLGNFGISFILKLFNKKKDYKKLCFGLIDKR